MITNELLEEKYRIQKRLSDAAGGDMDKYVENLQRIVREAEEKFNLKFKSADPLQATETESNTDHKV